LLGLRPLVTMNKEGEGDKIGNFKGQAKMLEHSLEIFRKDHETHGIDRYCVLYTDESEVTRANALAERMEAICGKKVEYVTQVSPVLGTAGYNGAIEIAYIMK